MHKKRQKSKQSQGALKGKVKLLKKHLEIETSCKLNHRFVSTKIYRVLTGKGGDGNFTKEKRHFLKKFSVKGMFKGIKIPVFC